MQNKYIECNFSLVFEVWVVMKWKNLWEIPSWHHSETCMGQQQEGWPFHSQPTDLCHFLLKGQPTAGIYCHLLQEPTLQEGIRHLAIILAHFSSKLCSSRCIWQKKGEIKKSILLARLHIPLSQILAVPVGNADLPDQPPCCRLFLLPHPKFELLSLLPVPRQTFLHMTQQRGTEGTGEISSSSLFQVVGHWTFWESSINVLVSVLVKKYQLNR